MESNRHDAHRDYPRGIVRYSLSLSLLAHYSSEKIEEDVEGEGEGDTVTTPGDTSGRPYKTSGSLPYRHQFVPRASRGNLGKEQRPTREEEMIEFVGKFPWTSRTFSYSCLLLLFFFLTSRTTAEYGKFPTFLLRCLNHFSIGESGSSDESDLVRLAEHDASLKFEIAFWLFFGSLFFGGVLSVKLFFFRFERPNEHVERTNAGQRFSFVYRREVHKEDYARDEQRDVVWTATWKTSKVRG